MIDTIIVPQGAEYRAVKQGLNKLKRKQPLIVSIPIGTNRIVETLNTQKFWQSQPKKVLMMGLCGSLSSQYHVGDFVLYQNCSSLDRENVATEPKLNQLIMQKLDRVSLVSGLMSDRIITSITEKQQLALNFSASVVDMESFAYLKLLQQKAISPKARRDADSEAGACAIAVSILRVVSDDVENNIPNLEQTIDESGNIKTGAMTKAMLKQPILSLKFIRNSLHSLQKLQQITTDLFAN